MFQSSYVHVWRKCCQFPSSLSGGSKLKLDQQKIKWLEAASQLPPIPALIQSAFTSLPCCNCWKHSFPLGWLCIHPFISLLHSWFSLNNCPHSSFLLYHPLHYLLTSQTFLVAIMVWRNAANPIFLTPFTKCDQKLFEFQSNIFIPPLSVWFTWQFCWSCFFCCLPELCHSSLPSNLLSRFIA